MYRSLRVFRGGNKDANWLTRDTNDSYDRNIEKKVGCEYLSTTEENKARIENILTGSPFSSDVQIKKN